MQTIFTGYPSQQTWSNYIDPVTLTITSGIQIPADAAISSVTITAFTLLYSGVYQQFFIGLPPISTNVAGTGQNAASTQITPLKAYGASGGDTNVTMQFSVSSSEFYRFKSVNEFTLSLVRKAYKSSGSTGKTYSANGWKINVIWDYGRTECSPPTSVTVQPTTAAPGGQAVLKWSGWSDGTNNPISGYFKIYKYLNSFSSAPEESILPIGQSYGQVVYAPPNNGDKYYFKIATGGSATGNYGPLSTTYATLTTSYSNPPAPKNLNSDSYSTLYIGTQSKPSTIPLNWSWGGDGTNNPVKDYSIYANNSLVKTTSTVPDSVSTPSSKTTYFVRANGTVAGTQSGNSNSVVVNIISAPTTTSLTNYPSTTNSNINLKWNAIASITGATIKYDIYLDTGSGGQNIATVATNSYTFDITKVNPGKSFKLGIRAKAQAINGGYRASAVTYTSNILRAGAFTLPSTFWTAVYDPNSTTPSGVQARAFNSIFLSWGAAQPTTGSGTSFTYYLYSREGTAGAWSLEVTVGNTGTRQFTKSISQYAAGSSIGFYVKVVDNFGVQVSSPTLEVRKINAPSFGTTNVSNIDYQKIDTSFTWGLNQTNESVGYKIYLEYNSKRVVLKEGTTSTSQAIKTISQPNLSVSLMNITSSSPVPFQQLKEQVITNKTAHPSASIIFEIFTAAFPLNKTTRTNAISLNYETPILANGNLSVTYPQSRNYFNPEDTMDFTYSGFSWKDASGGTSGATITFEIVSSYSGTRYLMPNDTLSLSAPAATTDLSITYTVSVTIRYSDASVNKNTVSVLVLVARWTREDLSLQGIMPYQGKIRGSFLLPNGLCSSSTYGNLVSIQLSAINDGQTIDSISFYKNNNYDSAGIIQGGTLAKDFIPQNRIIYFEIDSLINNSTISFSGNFLNTSSNALLISTSPYVWYIPEVDLAVRKGRIGINVDKNFNSTENAGDCSTLMINQKSQALTAPTIEINSTSSSGKIFEFAIQQVVRTRMNANQLIFFNNDYESKMTVNEDGEIELGISDSSGFYSKLKLKKYNQNPNSILTLEVKNSQGTNSYNIFNNSSIIPIANGGTGASNASQALVNLNGLSLAGGTMTGQIKRAGTSSNYVQGRDSSMIRTTTASADAYCPIISAKSASGSWQFGTYTEAGNLYLTYITDQNYNAGENTYGAQYIFQSDGTMTLKGMKLATPLGLAYGGTGGNGIEAANQSLKTPYHRGNITDCDDALSYGTYFCNTNTANKPSNANSPYGTLFVITSSYTFNGSSGLIDQFYVPLGRGPIWRRSRHNANAWSEWTLASLDAYPVGSIYMSYVSTSPASLFGGTWTPIVDRFLVGAGQAYSGGSTGGEVTVALQRTHLPNMQVPPLVSGDRFMTADQYTQPNQPDGWISPSSSGTVPIRWGVNWGTAILGDGTAHENRPPYFGVYMWRRTA